MKELINILEEKVEAVFESLGFDSSFGRLSISNRPDLCEYQCNGAMALAKKEKKNPFDIAEPVAKALSEDSAFLSAEAIRPGFINLKISPEFLRDYLVEMEGDAHISIPQTEGRNVFMDYGGPNVAKPLHVGHLRSAIIGESIKRILRATGVKVTSDIHLGDWGQQMGLIITELGKRGRKPPLTLSELEEIYPYASAKSKDDEEYKKEAMEATHRLQQGDEEYNNILRSILEVSIEDLKKNYKRLNVDFEIWKGESDAAPFIEEMVHTMEDKGLAYESEGALVVDVAEPDDKKEIPPCMILKSDGAALYNTTDLATLIWRMRDYSPDEIIYVVDKRQSLYFTQVFRCAKKAGLVPDSTELTFLGFGTMNGADGKPFKTRAGGVMRLSSLLSEVTEACQEKIQENEAIEESEKQDTAEMIALSAIKYGDLSNAPSKDYIFDMKRFISFEGDTGPYILYTMVRIRSILRKYQEAGGSDIKGSDLISSETEVEKNLSLVLSRYNSAVLSAGKELAPNRICGYIYELSNCFNSFYHETKILSCEEPKKKASYIALISLTLKVLSHAVDLLGFEAPERM